MFKSKIFPEGKEERKNSHEIESMWKRHSQLARRVAEEDMVLLKNDGILPLNIERIHSLAVIGPNAKYAR